MALNATPCIHTQSISMKMLQQEDPGSAQGYLTSILSLGSQAPISHEPLSTPLHWERRDSPQSLQ